LNKIAEQIQQEYRNKRELSNYSIFDIESSLKKLAEKGLIWVLKDMEDISELEEAGIEKYLNDYRANQIYDNLEDYFYLSPKRSDDNNILSIFTKNNIRTKTIIENSSPP